MAVLTVSGAVLTDSGDPIEARPLRPGETILDRPRPEVTEHGGRLGGIWVRPTVATGLTFDDNVFADDGRRRADLVSRVAPKVVADGQWRGHRASISASAERGSYLRQSGENYLDLEAQAFGRLRLFRRLHASATARATRGHLPRRSAEVADAAAEPTVYRTRSGEVLVGRAGEATDLRALVRARQTDYDDVAARGGGSLNTDDQDRWEGVLEVVEQTRLTPRLDRFLRSRLNVRRYAAEVDDRGFARDSYGHATVGGGTWRPTGLTTLEAYGGVRQQIYSDPRFQPLFLPTAGFSLTASPTQLTSVHLALDQAVKETTEPGASGRLVTALSGRIDHELRRDLLARVEARYAVDDYRGTGREDTHLSAGLSLTYLASRHLHAGLSLRHDRRDTAGASARAFARNRVGISLEVRY